MPEQIQLTFSVEAPPVRGSVLQDSEEDWMTTGLTWPSSSLELLAKHVRPGSAGKTSLASSQPTKDGTLVPSSEGWRNSGMGMHTEHLTLSTSECHKDAGVCSLSDILETGDHLQRYSLSAKACRGILRRAEKRGKELPPQLHKALRSVAQETNG